MNVRTDFDGVMAAAGGPLYVVTAAGADGPAGCLVGFATQTSIEPSRFLVCLSRVNRTWRAAAGAAHLGVHLVPATARPLAERFGGETGDEGGKFAGVAWRPGPHGVPLLDDCPARFVGRVVTRIDLGDHEGFLLAPEAADAEEAPPPLDLADVADVEPGHPA